MSFHLKLPGKEIYTNLINFREILKNINKFTRKNILVEMLGLSDIKMSGTAVVSVLIIMIIGNLIEPITGKIQIIGKV